MPSSVTNLNPESLITTNVNVKVIGTTDIFTDSNIGTLGDLNNSTGADFENNTTLGFTIEDFQLGVGESVTGVEVFVNYATGTKSSLILKGTTNNSLALEDFPQIGTYEGPPANNISFGNLGLTNVTDINNLRLSLFVSTEAGISEIRVAVTILSLSGGKVKLPKGKIILRGGKISLT